MIRRAINISVLLCLVLHVTQQLSGQCPHVFESATLKYYIPTNFHGNTFRDFNEQIIVYTSLPTAEVNIYNADGSYVNALSLTQNDIITIPLTENENEESAQTDDLNQVVSNRGFIFESDNIINLFYMVDGSNNRSLVRIKGETTIGTEFYPATMALDSTSALRTDASGQATEAHFISVMSSEPNTEVCFQKTGYFLEGLTNDETNSGDIDITSAHCITLPLIGDTYQVRSQNGCSNCDMNGIHITSDKPITVNSGTHHLRNAGSGGCRDGGIEQIPPANIGGDDFVVIRGDLDEGVEYFWVTALAPNTNIRLNGTVVATLANPGDSYNHIINGGRGTPYHITTDKDVQVYHVSGSAGCEVGYSLVPPTLSCAGNTLIPVTRIGTDPNTLAISVPTSSLASLTYNGLVVNATNFPTLISNPVAGTAPAITALSIGDSDILGLGTVGLLEASENFQSAITAGNSGGGGLFNYLTSPFYNFIIDDADNPTGFDNITYELECIEVGEQDTLNLDIQSCAIGPNNFVISGNIGDVSVIGNSLIYNATREGLDEFRVLITDANNITKSIFVLACVGDFDKDGFANFCDLDDDNDGILDEDEGCGLGLGTLADPFTDLYAAHRLMDAGRYYFDLGSGVFEADIDPNEGGGWVLILQYVHEANTNPDLTVIGAGSNLPELSLATLGTDESGSASWGHLGNAGFSSLDADELRFYGITSGHNRVIHFSTTTGISYAETGTGNFSGINTNFTPFTGHNANLPGAAVNNFSDRNDEALTNFPFWRSGNFHWGIRGGNSRWEVDDFARATQSTIHRVWARSTTPPCLDTDGDGIADFQDLDSDNDECPDAIEGSENILQADLNDDGSINIVNVSGIDSDGVPIAVSNGGQGQSIGSARDELINACVRKVYLNPHIMSNRRTE